ncbi:MAG: porin, partial [Verrucomicrobiia bacterium]
LLRLSINFIMHFIKRMNERIVTRSNLFKTILGFGIISMVSAAEMPSPEQMWAMIQKQQVQIESLTKRVAAAESQRAQTETKIVAAVSQVKQVDAKIEATSAYVETLADRGGSGSGGNAWYDRTSLGGYGEMHLNFGNTDQIDFHRWVLFFGHEFNDSMRMFSEFELEHSLSGNGKPGEVELEQAYAEFDLDENTRAKTGLFLLPIGMMNETHEPNTFYGVERNLVEKNIIPTTWWEGGAALSHTTDDGWGFDAALHSGLNTPTTGSNAFNIRSGRQKLAQAALKSGAATVRTKYTGIPGLELAASGQFQQDIAQGTLAESIDAVLLTAHMDWIKGPWGFRALYARWDLEGATPALLGRDEQFGYYLEPSYRFESEIGDWGFFGRFSTYDNSAGSVADTSNEYFDLGVNYWPHPNIVFKADVQFAQPANGADDETVNLGFGYMF